MIDGNFYKIVYFFHDEINSSQMLNNSCKFCCGLNLKLRFSVNLSVVVSKLLMIFVKFCALKVD